MYVGDWLALVTAEGALCGGSPGGPRVCVQVTEIVRGMQLTQKVIPLEYSKV